MPEPLVSVVMPAYNAEKFIAESIDSILSQTYANWELIIVDDGSTDNTAIVVRPFLTDKRVSYIYQENARQGKARNAAIHASKGEYIAFLDADDLWLKDKLTVSLNAFDVNCDLVFTDSYLFEKECPDGVPLKTMGVEAHTYQGKESIIMFLDYNRIPNLTVVVRKTALIQAGDFTDRVVAEEYEMWLQLLKNGCVFRSLAIPLSLYRVHDQSITAKDRHATFEIVAIIKDFVAKYPEYRDEARKILRRKIIYWLNNGAQKSGENFRFLIAGIYTFPVHVLLYTLSFVLKPGQLKKIVLRVP